jgi:predicted secreted protein
MPVRPPSSSVRVAELAALIAILAPALGWLMPLLPFERGSSLYEAALAGFALLGLVGLMSFTAASALLLWVRFTQPERPNMRRAVLLTASAPATWFACWLLAILWFAYTLTSPEPWDRFFDGFGGAH